MSRRSAGGRTRAVRYSRPSAQGHRVGPHRALLLLHRLDRTRLVGVDHLTGLAFALLERDPAKTTLEQRANRLDVAARAHQFLLTGAPPIQVADCRSVLAALVKIVRLRANLLTV